MKPVVVRSFMRKKPDKGEFGDLVVVATLEEIAEGARRIIGSRMKVLEGKEEESPAGAGEPLPGSRHSYPKRTEHPENRRDLHHRPREAADRTEAEGEGRG